ncbi:flagellin [Gammaproteobacteria bacterium]|jgi:flagellin|nr:flagellin [Gammaproteobacteria bacterium]MDA9578313.1 flagellin [Gammaproteobacteria bacterium]
MTVINTNISANIARDAIGRNDRAMATSMERLSTGLRINSAKDDAAGLAISNRMAGQISGLNMAARNANDAMSMVQTIEGASKEIGNMLVRMRELAVQSASGTYSDTDRAALDSEYQALETEIGRIQANTQWNGQALMTNATAGTANTVDIQIGASASQTMTLTFKDWGVDHASAAIGVDITGEDITSASNATSAITALDTAINGATAEQAKYGAYISRLQYAADNLSNVATNTDQSRSRIQDADYAVETTALARTQIIAQASTAMLAQANQVKQTVLALLQ